MATAAPSAPPSDLSPKRTTVSRIGLGSRVYGPFAVIDEPALEDGRRTKLQTTPESADTAETKIKQKDADCQRASQT